MSTLPDTNMTGWFAIAFSKELKANQSKTGMLANEHYTLSRTSDGVLIFNNCNHDIREQNGIIYVWRHTHGLKSDWYIPVLDEKNWSPLLHHQLRARTHPQEVYENCIDVTHFSVVHDFSDITLTHGPTFAAQRLSVAYRLKRKNQVEALFRLRLYGMGCAHTHIYVPAYGLRVRMFALTTPTHAGLVDIRLSVAVMNTGWRVKKIILPLLHRLIWKNIINDFSQDIPVWENKQYLVKPLLVKGDGHIMKFRRWCGQFYGAGA